MSGSFKSVPTMIQIPSARLFFLSAFHPQIFLLQRSLAVGISNSLKKKTLVLTTRAGFALQPHASGTQEDDTGILPRVHFPVSSRTPRAL